MRHERYRGEDVVTFLRETKIARIDELKRVLGTTVDITVTRKLRGLSYLTSYSHRGRYYTLQEIARFDWRGLWSCGPARFSRFGTLVATSEVFVEQSDAGWFAGELEDELEVSVKDALLNLVRQGRITREKVAGRYLYCSSDQGLRKRQLTLRRGALENVVLGAALEPEACPDELKAAILLFHASLNEKERRLYAGLEAARWGHGGDRKIANFLGIDVHTVAKGRRELLAQDFAVEQVRKAGGGRKRVEKKAQR